MEKKKVIVSKDEGPRPTTKEGLAKLKPAFKENGSTTAGNASQVSDGAAAVLVTRRSIAKKIIGKFLELLEVITFRECLRESWE